MKKRYIAIFYDLQDRASTAYAALDVEVRDEAYAEDRAQEMAEEVAQQSGRLLIDVMTPEDMHREADRHSNRLMNPDYSRDEFGKLQQHE